MMICCFCSKELADIGNSPYPFKKRENPTGGEYGCCDRCNELFVNPARQLVKYGISDNDWDEVLCQIKTALAEQR